jgi:septal ring factor EnvC (AmiA/AmiB activator)
LTPDVIAGMREIRAAIEAQLPRRVADATELERELRDVKAEQKRLTKAVALADDVPELVTELRQRAARARALEVQIATIRRAPSELRALVDQAEATVRRCGLVRIAIATTRTRRPARVSCTVPVKGSRCPRPGRRWGLAKRVPCGPKAFATFEPSR